MVKLFHPQWSKLFEKREFLFSCNDRLKKLKSGLGSQLKLVIRADDRKFQKLPQDDNLLVFHLLDMGSNLVVAIGFARAWNCP